MVDGGVEHKTIVEVARHETRVVVKVFEYLGMNCVTINYALAAILLSIKLYIAFPE